jgi:hypothetical protein
VARRSAAPSIGAQPRLTSYHPLTHVWMGAHAPYAMVTPAAFALRPSAPRTSPIPPGPIPKVPVLRRSPRGRTGSWWSGLYARSVSWVPGGGQNGRRGQTWVDRGL